MEIIKEISNPLFKRKEIKATLESEISPSNSEVEKQLAEKFSVPAKNIKIKNILGKFGSKIFTINANIYESADDKETTEPKSKKQRDAEAPKEEAPKQETKPKEIKEEKIE